MHDFRPLRSISRALQALCGIQYYRLNKDGSVRPGLFYSGWRNRVQSFAIGLDWMSRGYQYDTRGFFGRIRSGAPYIRFAFTGRYRKEAA